MLQADRVKPHNLSDTENSSIEFIKNAGIDFSLLATTPTMKRKKITDATKIISDYFQRIGFHDYRHQDFGAKVIKSVYFHTEERSIPSSGSFYRAGTRGDKRLNLTNFWDYTDGDEVNMLVVHNDILNVINISRTNLSDCWNLSKSSNVKKFLHALISAKSTPVFDTKELTEIEKSDQVVIEGKLKELKVLARSRNKKIAKNRKEQDLYTCKACRFHYNNKIVECHHLTPLSMVKENSVSLNDLITLCPTCHSIAHQLLKNDSENNIDANTLINNIKEILGEIYNR